MIRYYKKTAMITSLLILVPSLVCGFINIFTSVSGCSPSVCWEPFIIYAAEKKDPVPEKVKSENLLNEDSADQVQAGEINNTEGGGFSFSADAFTEIENYYSTDKDKTEKERNLKNELRINFEFKAGTENLYLFSKTNLYYIPPFDDKEYGENYYYSNGLEVSDSMKISDEHYEIEPAELYLNYSNSLFRMRAGNQIYLWGTADVYNPTSYFNPLDLREYVFADEDELKLAVPSASLMFLLDSAAVEIVFVPVHIPAELPADGNYWQIESGSPAATLNMQENKGLEKDISNSAYGIRTAFTPGGVDVSLSYYHGPDRNPVFVPQYIDFSNAPPSVELKPEYFILNMFGFDLSTQISDFVIQCEAVYSPDKTWLVEREMNEFILANISGKSPYETKESDFFHYAVGFNYYLPVNSFFRDYDGESIITVEWQQPWYPDKDLSAPLITKILLLRFEEICYESRLRISLSYLAELNKDAYVVKPEMKYDFQNGFSIKASYVYIDADSDTESVLPGEDTSVIYFVRDKDMVTFSARYDF